jgi:hypothetical protein
MTIERWIWLRSSAIPEGDRRETIHSHEPRSALLGRISG